MKAYVLGLREGFRGQSLLERLVELGFVVELVEGIDAREGCSSEVSDRYDEARARVVCGRPLAASEVACAIGHQRMYRRMLEEGEAWALMFEDDASIDARVLQVIPTLSRLPSRSVVTLRHNDAGALHCRPWSKSLGVARRLWSMPQGASAYFMDRGAAAVALAASEGSCVDSAPDWPLTWCTRVKWWVSTENLAPHAETGSLLEEGHNAAAGALVAPWGTGGLIDRIRWARRLIGVGYPPLTSLRVAVLQPMFGRMSKLLFPKRTQVSPAFVHSPTSSTAAR